MNDETLALVNRARAGDSAAFSELAEEHRRVAGGVAYGILNDAHLAADAVQDAFLKAFQKLEQLNEPQAFPAWFLNIVRASAIDIIRRRRRWGSQEVALTEEAIVPDDAALGGSAPASPPEAMVRAEDATEIRAALSDLSAEYREVIILKHLEGRSYRQIARLLKTSVRSVESKLFRARQQLSRSLRAKGVRAAPMLRPGAVGPDHVEPGVNHDGGVVSSQSNKSNNGPVRGRRADVPKRASAARSKLDERRDSPDNGHGRRPVMGGGP